jgi:hypothetical protein
MRYLPTFLSRQPYSEPVKEVFIPVKNQKGEEFTLRQWRDSIKEPLRREILAKKVQVWVKDIQIQEDEIGKQLYCENSSLAEWTIEGFIQILKNILGEERGYLKSEMESDNPREELVFYESDYPLVLFLKLTPYLIERVFYNIDRVIPASDREFLKDFIRRHNERDDVIPLKVVWDFE